MRGFLLVFLLALACYLWASPVFSSIHAAVLKFNPTTFTIAPESTVDVQVLVDSGEDQIAGTDIYILYDTTLLSPQSVTAGTHFPIVSHNITSGKVYISAVVESSSQYKTGEGIVATIQFKGLQDGQTNVTFDCDLSRNDGSKIVKNDINATNIINCSGLTTLTAIVSSTDGSSGSSGTSGTSDTGGSTTTTTGIPQTSTLPESGVYDSLVKYSIPALALLAIGTILKFLH